MYSAKDYVLAIEKSYRTPRRVAIFIVVFLLLFGAMSLFATICFVLANDAKWQGSLFFLSLSFVTAFIFLMALLSYYSASVLKIYSHAIISPHRTFWEALRKRERILYFSDIEKVDLHISDVRSEIVVFHRKFGKIHIDKRYLGDIEKVRDILHQKVKVVNG